MVSLRCNIGMGSVLLTGPIFGNVGRVAVRSTRGFSPFLLAALNSALSRLASSLARALLTVWVTIFMSALVTLRSQYPESPPSAAGIQ